MSDRYEIYNVEYAVFLWNLLVAEALYNVFVWEMGEQFTCIEFYYMCCFDSEIFCNIQSEKSDQEKQVHEVWQIPGEFKKIQNTWFWFRV